VRARRALVVTEFALAIVLLAGAGLLIRSLVSVQNVDPGFRPERVLSVALASPATMPPAQRAAFYNRVLDRIETAPGVESAAIASELFLTAGSAQVVTLEGAAGLVSERRQFRSDEMSDGFFTTIGAPLRKGRFFSKADTPDSPPVAIVNEAMARQLWPRSDPVGKRFKFGDPASANPWFTVVGIVGDMRRQGLETEPIPQMFQPLSQNPPRRAILLVRTSMADPFSLAGAVQAAVHRIEKHAVLYGVTTLENRLDAFLTERRFQTSLLFGFSLAALLMAAIGIYGLIQYSIALRTREIGIRIAIGAPASGIFRMVLGEGLKLALIGLAAGLAGSFWLARIASSLLFGVTATDPATFLTVSLLLVAVAGAACYFPARRAMKVDPIAALRLE
jgi:putative ABC transport system permease protein